VTDRERRRLARLAPERFYLFPDGSVHAVAGVAHLEDDEGAITLPTTDDKPVVLRRVEFDK
jgi:hypothetical protein